MTQTSLEPRELSVIERWKEVPLRRGSTFRNNFCHQSSSTDLKASDKTAMLLTDNCLLTLLSILVTFSNYRLSIHLAVDYNRKTSIIFLPEQMRRVFMNKSDIHLVVFSE